MPHPPTSTPPDRVHTRSSCSHRRPGLLPEGCPVNDARGRLGPAFAGCRTEGRRIVRQADPIGSQHAAQRFETASASARPGCCASASARRGSRSGVGGTLTFLGAPRATTAGVRGRRATASPHRARDAATSRASRPLDRGRHGVAQEFRLLFLARRSAPARDHHRVLV